MHELSTAQTCLFSNLSIWLRPPSSGWKQASQHLCLPVSDTIPNPLHLPLCFYHKDPLRVTWSHGFWCSVRPSWRNAPSGQGSKESKDREHCCAAKLDKWSNLSLLWRHARNCRWYTGGTPLCLFRINSILSALLAFHELEVRCVASMAGLVQWAPLLSSQTCVF